MGVSKAQARRGRAPAFRGLVSKFAKFLLLSACLVCAVTADDGAESDTVTAEPDTVTADDSAESDTVTADDSAEPDTQILGHSIGWWVAGSVLAMELAIGFGFWLSHSQQDIRFPDKIITLFHLLNGPMQFLPFLALKLGWVKCDTGVWWPVHWFYLGSLMIGMPDLTMTNNMTSIEVMEDFKLPILGCKGTFPAKAYVFIVGVMNATDVYMDVMTCAIAFSCGWDLARVMLATLFFGLILQVIAAAILSPQPKWYGAASGVLLGDSLEAAAGSLGENGKRFAASQGLARFFTENCPQAYLSVRFALEVKPSKTVWASVAISLILSFKAFVDGAVYFCKGSGYASVPTQ